VLKKIAGVLLILQFISSQGAFAHGEISNTSPKKGATIGALPSLLWVEFDGNPIVIKGKQSNFLIVKDSKGIIINDGITQVSGPRLSTKIKNLGTVGKITVTWRAVSEDGHPVNGTYFFIVKPKAKS